MAAFFTRVLSKSKEAANAEECESENAWVKLEPERLVKAHPSMVPRPKFWWHDGGSCPVFS
jgi:hypothetical protein